MKDDRGAMMLLTAVILVIGFIALSGMAARLGQLPEQAELDRQVKFFEEADRVANGITAVLGVYDCTEVTHLNHINATMEHFQIVETGRGFGFWYDLSECHGGTNAISFKLAGAGSAIQLRIAP